MALQSFRQKVVSSIMFILIAIIIWDAMFPSPEHRLLKPDFADTLYDGSRPIQAKVPLVCCY
jgi:hypothetical protein